MSASTHTTTSNLTKKKRKKVVIRSYKKPPLVPPEFYATQSQFVLNATSNVINSNTSNTSSSLQQAHDRVVDLVQLKMGPRFYTALCASMKQACVSIINGNEDSLLTTIPRQYANFLEYLGIVQHVCLALDRNYLYNFEQGEAVLRSSNNPSKTNNTSLLSLWQVGLRVFHARLEELSLDQDLYMAWWNELWESSWKNNSSSVSKLQDSMNMWVQLGCKKSILKNKLQPLLIQHLEQEASTHYSNKNAVQFVEYVMQKWNLVASVWSSFLPKLWIKSLVEVYLLQPNLSDIITKMTIDDISHVHRLYVLSARLPDQHAAITKQIIDYSQERGKSILEQHQYSYKSIQGLLQLYSQLKALQKELGTTLPLGKVFSVLMSEPQAAEGLAKFLDVSFKSTKQTPPLHESLELFCHVSAKDVFEAFYKRDLAKRLLGGRVVNLDLEKHFLSLLKSECGAGYTSKMEGMFQDIDWSNDIMSRFTKRSAVDMEVQVLTTGYWPVYPSYDLTLPPELLEPQGYFEEYYTKTFQGRRISWQNALGQVTVKARFPKKQYDFIMSLSLGLVLLCFNSPEKEKWTMPELQQQIGLEDKAEMERILMTLALGKVKLLQKWDHDAQPGCKPRANVHDDDWFTINNDFNSPLKKIKISMIAKDTNNHEERQTTMDMISRDRLYLLDAVLVRIMKARKTILHSELIPLVMEHAKVPVTPTDVKGRVESLMDREYMERDKEDRNRYNYLA
jgi:cullin-4